jgi:drug/metabolite transporter (DMT)-like permease
MLNWRSHSLLLLAAFVWGVSNVSQQDVLKYIGPITTVGLRCLLASIVILPLVWQTKQHLPNIFRTGKLLAFVTALTFCVAVCLAQIGIGYTTVINTSFFINTWTIMTPICVWVLQRVRPAKLMVPAGGLALAGTFFMTGGQLDSLNIGDVLCLLAAFVYSMWAVCLTEFVRKFEAPFLISFFQFLFSGTVCVVFGLMNEPFDLQLFPEAIPDLIILGVFSTGLGYVLQAIAQAKVSASTGAVILSMEAIFGALGGVLLLGENFTTMTFFGAALIFSAVVLVQIPGFETVPTRQKKVLGMQNVQAL